MLAIPISYYFVGLLALCIIIQLFYYLWYFLPVLLGKSEERKGQSGISVIICAKNEAENLRKNLPEVLNQHYASFEVIVVNDGSTDDTELVLGTLMAEYKNLRSTSLPLNNRFHHGKKMALTIGVKAAKFDRMIFTDADCRPSSQDWLKLMNDAWAPDKELVLGYGAYQWHPGLLNHLIRYENLFNALLYLGMASRGEAYMGVGRNMGYTKSVYQRMNGFATHSHLMSGDDDLFVNAAANKKNTSIQTDINAYTLSDPPKTWRAYFKRKKRHLTTFPHYKGTHKFKLGIEIITRQLSYFLAVFLFVLQFEPMIVGGLIIFKLFVQLLIIQLAFRKMNEKYLLLLTIVWDWLVPFLNLIVHLMNISGPKSNKWK